MGGMMKGRIGAEAEMGKGRGFEIPGSEFAHEATVIIGEERFRAAEPEAMKDAEAARRRFGELQDISGDAGAIKSARTRSFESFLEVGEREAVTTVPIPDQLPFWRGLAHFLKANAVKLFAGVGGGFGAPMMIFSGFLKGDGRAPSRIDFQEGFDGFNTQLKAFDEAASLKRAGKALTLEQEQRLADPQFTELNQKRADFVKANYYWHALESAKDPSSSVHQHLDTHFRPDELGSHLHFGKGEVLRNPAQAIDIAEQAIQYGYRGMIRPGEVDQWVHVTESGESVPVNVEMMPTDGIYGASVPGGRVVMKLSFSRPIGRDGIVPIEPHHNPRKVQRTAGGRNEEVSLVDGPKDATDTIYVIGGAYGPTGKFGIYTLFAGTYAPPMTDTVFWGKHAFVTGHEAPISAARFRSIRGLYESNNLEPVTATFNQYVATENGVIYVHELISRGEVTLEGTFRKVAVTTVALREIQDSSTGQKGVSVDAAPRAPSEITAYRLFAGTSDDAAGVRVKTSDPALIEEIHRSFLSVYAETGSAIEAFDWLLNKSKWANSGLIKFGL